VFFQSARLFCRQPEEHEDEEHEHEHDDYDYEHEHEHDDYDYEHEHEHDDYDYEHEHEHEGRRLLTDAGVHRQPGTASGTANAYGRRRPSSGQNGVGSSGAM
jgi:hypothetical protein